MAPAPTLASGPLVTEARRQRVLDYLEIAADERLAGGHFVRPALLTHVTHEMHVAQEEIFGPVTAIIRLDDEGEGTVSPTPPTSGWSLACSAEIRSRNESR